MFVDEVDIYVKAGDGGRGAVSFRREKFVPRGGPDGGDGGPGGSVYLVATPHRNTLVHFRFNPEFRAQRGRSGSGNNRSGKHGEVLEIPVPVGTLVQARDPEFRLRRGFGGQVDDELVAVADLTVPGQRVLVAKGGRGGLGNARFVSSTNRAPRKAQPGAPGEERHLHLQLKLLADMGLVGFPNAGKSTLIARVSAAKPKIADYPFTTLTPNLGVVTLSDDRSFVVADVPGLIEGAHEGHGLGHQFLRHIERTKVLVHLVDVSSASGRDPVEDFDTIRRELELYNPALVEKPQLVAANKVDALDDPEHVARLEAAARARNLPFHRISAVTGEGVQALLEAAWPFIAEAREAEAPADAQDRAPSMTPAVRVGVLGGTFDPVHLGHLAAARAAQDALSLTEVRFIPSHHPPHRPGSPLASSADRLAMVEAAVAGTPGWHASDLELRRQGPSYTYDTLAALHDEGLSASQIFFILGADAFAEIQTWSRYPDVLDAAHFVVVARHGTALERIPSRVPEIVPRLASPADAAASDRTRVIFIEADTPDVSSTDLRERASRGADISDAVPAAVAELIARRRLYQQFTIQNSEFKNRNKNRSKNGSKNSKNRNSTDTRVRR